jgi:hypothetical protein
MRAVWGMLAGLGGLAWMAPGASAREWFELRVIRIESAEKAAVLDACLAEDGMRVLADQGIRAGVFRERDGSSHDRYVLLVHSDAASLGRPLVGPDDADDAAPAARAYLAADPKDPVFTRHEVYLLQAFASLPQLQDPPGDGGGDRYFELRIYESPTEILGVRKVEMFEGGGEIELFRKSGLDIVFFGQAVAGPNLPQLTYMLVYDDEADKDASWKTFVESDEWNTMKALPRYADSVSRIHSHFLVAMPYSAIR